MKYTYIFCLVCCSTLLFSQNTKSLGDKVSPRAKLKDVEWIKGHWRGDAFGGQIEEIWSPPLGGSMMGSFKMVIRNEVTFYELMHIQEIDGTLLLQIRHFNQDFTGWETQNESVNFPLVAVDDSHVYFDGLTFVKKSANEMDVYVLTSEAGEEKQESKFSYQRFKE